MFCTFKTAILFYFYSKKINTDKTVFAVLSDFNLFIIFNFVSNKKRMLFQVSTNYMYYSDVILINKL